MEKREIPFHRKKFRQINCLVKLVKPLLSRNFCEKSLREFLVFPHCAARLHSVENEKFSLTWKIFRQNNSLVTYFRKTVTFTSFLPKMHEIHTYVEFPVFSHCGLYKTRSRFYGKTNTFSVKVTFLLNKLLMSWFHEFF